MFPGEILGRAVTYPKPERSAGLVIGGMCAIAAGWALRLVGVSEHDGIALAILGWASLFAGIITLSVGIHRILEALDHALLRRWQDDQPPRAPAAERAAGE